MNAFIDLINSIKKKFNYFFKSPIQCQIESLDLKITDTDFYDKVEVIFNSCESRDELYFACSFLTDQTKELSSSIHYMEIKALFARRLEKMEHPEFTRLLNRYLCEQYYYPLVEKEIKRLLVENNALKGEGTVAAMAQLDKNIHKINALKSSKWHNVTYRYDDITGEDVYTPHTTKPGLNGYPPGKLNSKVSLRGRCESEYWSSIELRCPSDENKVDRFDNYYLNKEDKGELSQEFKRKILNTELQYAYNKHVHEEKYFDKEYDSFSENM